MAVLVSSSVLSAYPQFWGLIIHWCTVPGLISLAVSAEPVLLGSSHHWMMGLSTTNLTFFPSSQRYFAVIMNVATPHTTIGSWERRARLSIYLRWVARRDTHFKLLLALCYYVQWCANFSCSPQIQDSVNISSDKSQNPVYVLSLCVFISDELFAVHW